MNLRDLVLKNRSYRRFDESYAISREELVSFVDLARHSASARNAQPLKYILSWTPERNALIFPCLAWAAYLKNWKGPDEGERPSAYIVMLGDTEISNQYFCDHGIAAQSILLGATEKGYGGCIIGSVNKELLYKNLGIPQRYEILQVIALGKPAENVVIEPMPSDGDYKYWRDEQNVHHVPKRSLEELILNL
ncbi:MAG TPA: nitroreductase family protein [Bacteroidales bacterium]|nr:nitroreductase family protein [Bacteroidales bacterium]HQH40307.1 nitroreductase family protein [Bacteroidales bacterium]HQK37324.1 nitroreductase family protein [Bacteroidales bacterium]